MILVLPFLVDNDVVDLTMDIFYDALISKKQFPKTSLPDLSLVEEKVMKCINEGDDVIILTISSGISGLETKADNELIIKFLISLLIIFRLSNFNE